MKAFKAFKKLFAAPQRSVKIKIKLIFILMQLPKMHRAGRVKKESPVYTHLHMFKFSSAQKCLMTF